MRRNLKAAGRALLVAAAVLALPAPAALATGSVTHVDPLPPLGFGTFSAPSGEMATDWCGDEKATDDAVNETGALDAHKIRAVEAVPADRSPSSGTRTGIQRIVATLSAHVAAESGQRRSLRFDMGTRCGPRYLDILTLRLPKTSAAYGSDACNTGPLLADVRSALPKGSGPRNAVVFAPSIACSSMAGFGEFRYDDRPGSANVSNQGGFVAVSFLLNSGVALHEIGHNLGAVQMSAPHTDVYAHCWDKDDVMCYPYTQYLPRSPLRPCDSPRVEPFDCGKDDYFNPDPAPGSYLDTHWNVYDSAFMCPVAECVPIPPPAVAAPPEPPPPPPPPPPTPPGEQHSSGPAPPAAPAPATTRPRSTPAPAAKPRAKPRSTRCKIRRKAGKKVRRCPKRGVMRGR